MLSLGVPLWTILDDNEKVALLAHQIAHDADGDPVPHPVAAEAVASLSATPPGDAVALDAAPPGLLELPDARTRHSANRYAEREATFRAMRRGTAAIVRTVRAAVARLLYPANRRSEYVADDIAIRIASSGAMRGLLEKTLLKDYVDYGLRKAARDEEENAWPTTRNTVARVPQRELERVRRAAVLRGDRIDATHPPTALRLRFIDSRPPTAAQVTPAPGQMYAVDEELSAAFKSVAITIFDRLTS